MLGWGGMIVVVGRLWSWHGAAREQEVCGGRTSQNGADFRPQEGGGRGREGRPGEERGGKGTERWGGEEKRDLAGQANWTYPLYSVPLCNQLCLVLCVLSWLHPAVRDSWAPREEGGNQNESAVVACTVEGWVFGVYGGG